MMDFFVVMVGLLVFMVNVALYFLPTIMAAVKGKRNVWAIGGLNLMVGWTGIGWIGAMVWALMADEK